MRFEVDESKLKDGIRRSTGVPAWRAPDDGDLRVVEDLKWPAAVLGLVIAFFAVIGLLGYALLNAL